MKYFDLQEFASADEAGSGIRMKQDFLIMLDKAREIAGVPFVINSGYRTPEHNKKVGGVKSSSHLKGCAADIKAKTSGDRYSILNALLKVGFKRIGIAETFIHVDNDKDKPEGLVWIY